MDGRKESRDERMAFNVIWANEEGTGTYRLIEIKEMPRGEEQWDHGPYTVEMRLDPMLFEVENERVVEAFIFCGVRKGEC
jgi:hypothetical protein